jgi:hypothetical protein
MPRCRGWASPFSCPSVRFCSTDMSLPTRVCERVAGAAHAMDLLQVERLAATPRPDTPPLSAAPLVDLMVHVARAARDSGAVKEAALVRLKQTESPKLLAAFFFALGIVWRHLPSDHPQVDNATQNSFMSFQAATEVRRSCAKRAVQR